MRKFLVLPALLLTASMSSCVLPTISSTRAVSSPTASLGPDGVDVEQSQSSLYARIESGFSWLFSCRMRLKKMGVDVTALEEAISWMGDSIAKGDWTEALARYAKARAVVTAIAAASGV